MSSKTSKTSAAQKTKTAEKLISSTFEKVTKRDGRIVEFEPTKIMSVVEKAFDSTQTPSTEKLLISITNAVTKELSETFKDEVPHIESIQDEVEKQIADAGFFEVSRAYIIYRQHQTKLREQKEKAASGMKVNIVKRNGEQTVFDFNVLESYVRNIFDGLLDKIEMYDVLEDVRRGIFDGITTDQINESIIFATRARIEKDPAFSYISARLVMNGLYKKVLGKDEFEEGFEKTYRSKFEENIKLGVAAKRLDAEMLNYDFKVLSEALVIERDKDFTYLGAQTLIDKYYVRDEDQNILEVAQYFWMRVAMGLALYEKKKERETKAIEFYNLFSKKLYVSSTPTLLHAGHIHAQMSSCYLTTVEDNLNHIFKSYNDQAHLAKWSGGLGMDWTNVRATGALIKSINVPSQGVIPFLKICDTTTASINRSGKRRGAAVVYLEPWHFDIESFLELRKNTGDERRRTHDTNTALWIPDLFMKRVMEDGYWTLFSPEETPELHHIYGKEFEKQYKKYENDAATGKIRLHKTVRARDMWRKMLTMLFETGHPWMTFKDPCNIRSPQDHVGVVHSSNLCTEITLNTSKDETAVCNLGSVNVSRHITEDGQLDREKLANTVKTAMRMLDNVIDQNFYPTKEAKNSNIKHRPVGLGMMGYQNALYAMDMTFDSEEAVKFSDELQEFISYHAILASSELAKERGTYSSYKGSKWDRNLFPIDTFKMAEEERGVKTDIPLNSRMDWSKVRDHVKKHGMRNSNTMAIAPTATISNISGCYPSIEPIYRNLYVKSNMVGEFAVVNEALVEDLKSLGLWDSEMLNKIKHFDGDIQAIREIPIHIRVKYKGAFEIDPAWVIRHAAHRSKWQDQAQSINIFSATTKGSVLSDIYFNAWKSGLKTTYYLRTLGATAIEKSSVGLSSSNTDLTKSSLIPASARKASQASVSTESALVAAGVSASAPVSSTSAGVASANVSSGTVNSSVGTYAAVTTATAPTAQNVPAHAKVKVAEVKTTVTKTTTAPAMSVVKSSGVSISTADAIAAASGAKIAMPKAISAVEVEESDEMDLGSSATAVKDVCRLDDPTCESCQ